MRLSYPLAKRCWLLLLASCLTGAIAGCAYFLAPAGSASAEATPANAAASHGVATLDRQQLARLTLIPESATTSTTPTTDTTPAALDFIPAGTAEGESILGGDTQAQPAAQTKEDQTFMATYLAARLAMGAGDKAQALALLEKCRQQPACPALIYAAIAEVQHSQIDLDKTNETLAAGLKKYPHDARLLLMRAKIQRQMGKIDDAIATLEEALTSEPLNQKALEELSELHLQRLRGVTSDEGLQKEVDELVRIYERMLAGRQGEARLGPLLILSSLYLRTAQPERAIPVAREAVEINRREPRCYLALAAAQEALKKPADALETYKQALIVDPTNDEVRDKLEQAAQKAGAGADAIYTELAKSFPHDQGLQDLYLQTLIRQGHWNDAQAQVNQMLAQWPDDKALRAAQGRVLVAQGHTEEAAALVEQLGRDKAELAPGTALAVAEALAGRDDRPRALDVLRRFQAAHPQEENVTMALAGMLIDEKQYDEASRMLEGFHRDRPDFFIASVLLVQVYAEQKRYDEAQKLLGALPENAKKEYKKDLLQMQADLYRRQKSYDKALETVNQLIQSDPEVALNYLTAGMIYQEMGRNSEAEQNYQKALEIEPDDAEANNTLGFFYAETNQKLDQAEVLVNKALKIKPEAGHILDSLGWVLYRRGDYQGACARLEEAVKQMADEPDAVVFDHLGDAYEKLGKLDKAREAWTRAGQLDQSLAGPKEKLARTAASVSR